MPENLNGKVIDMGLINVKRFKWIKIEKQMKKQSDEETFVTKVGERSFRNVFLDKIRPFLKYGRSNISAFIAK